MPNRQKQKGNRRERQFVKMAQDAGDPDAIRARGSDGRSLGRPETVDAVAFGHGFQVKGRKTIAKYLYPPEGCLATIVVEDYQEPLAVVKLSWLLEVLRDEKDT